MVTSRVIGCGSEFIGPTTIAFTQALNPRPAIRWGRETATAVGWAVNSVSPPTRIISLISGSASGAGGSVLGCQGAGKSAHRDLHRRHWGKAALSAGWTTNLLLKPAFFVSDQLGRGLR